MKTPVKGRFDSLNPSTIRGASNDSAYKVILEDLYIDRNRKNT